MCVGPFAPKAPEINIPPMPPPPPPPTPAATIAEPTSPFTLSPKKRRMGKRGQFLGTSTSSKVMGLPTISGSSSSGGVGLPGIGG
jgi:hypothetical protein